jgi:hypothetical protein
MMAHDHRTEAACLLEQGATYRRRIGLKPVVAPGDPIFAGFKHGAFSLYFGDAPIYHFDLEGRWQRAFVEGTHFLKGLDGTIHAIDRVREGANLILKRRALSSGEARDCDAQARWAATELIAGLDGDLLRRIEPASPKAQPLTTEALREFLERIGCWDSDAWLAHCERYRSVYGPLSFLPPECQNAVVLQATPGHDSGIAFGGAAARATGATGMRSSAEFDQHTKDVAALWGRRLLQSRVLFLAGGDVVHQPVATIVSLLHAIGRTFPIERRLRGATANRSEEDDQPRFEGVHMFLDDFALPRPDRDGWRELAASGLVRISLGVESGHPEVRRMYQKRWDDDELRATVVASKAAGLGVSVLTLVGAGGVEHAGGHVEQTGRLIESLELAAGDFVFLLDENEIREPSSVPDGMKMIQGQAWREQQARLKEALMPLKHKGVKVLPYTLEKQWT